MTSDPVSDFWAWFSSASDKILEQLTDSEIEATAGTSIAELDKRVRRISPDLRWEIGPFLDETTFLAISPNGIRDQLQLTRRVVEAAPTVPGWRFLPAKPPKNTNRFGFEFGGNRFDTSNWQYTLLRWDDPVQYGVTWVPDKPIPKEWVSPDSLAWFVLVSEIGEEAAISLFEFAEIADGPVTNGTEIEYFREHFHEIRENDP